MNQNKIIKQVKGTGREQIETITLIAKPVVLYTPEQMKMDFSDLDTDLPHTYKVKQRITCARVKKKFDPVTQTWNFDGFDRFSRAQAKFYELVGKFTFTQLSATSGAILKVTKDEKINC